MKAEKLGLLLGAVVIVVLGGTIAVKAEVFGVSSAKVEKDARQQLQIENNWNAVSDKQGDICAVLFYDEDKEDYRFASYRKKKTPSMGYFFQEGGKEYPYIGQGVQGMIYEDTGIVLASMNQDKVGKIVAEGVDQTREYNVDSTAPFTVVLPIESGKITLYDTQGQIVTLYDTFKD